MSQDTTLHPMNCKVATVARAMPYASPLLPLPPPPLLLLLLLRRVTVSGMPFLGTSPVGVEAQAVSRSAVKS
jgi:hypothetical protein